MRHTIGVGETDVPDSTALAYTCHQFVSRFYRGPDKGAGVGENLARPRLPDYCLVGFRYQYDSSTNCVRGREGGAAGCAATGAKRTPRAPDPRSRGTPRRSTPLQPPPRLRTEYRSPLGLRLPPFRLASWTFETVTGTPQSVRVIGSPLRRTRSRSGSGRGSSSKSSTGSLQTRAGEHICGRRRGDVVSRCPPRRMNVDTGGVVSVTPAPVAQSRRSEQLGRFHPGQHVAPPSSQVDTPAFHFGPLFCRVALAALTSPRRGVPNRRRPRPRRGRRRWRCTTGGPRPASARGRGAPD